MNLSKTDFKAIRAKAHVRDIKRASNRAYIKASNRLRINKKDQPTPIRNVIGRKSLKDAIVRLLGLLYRKEHGPLCALGQYCPDYRKIGIHQGDRAYHLTSQKRGDAGRFVRENVVWACNSANFGEHMNRDIYRDKHISIWGRDYIERIEAISRTIKKYSMADLLELRTRLKAELECTHKSGFDCDGREATCQCK